MLGKLVVGEIAVGEVVTGEIVLGKLRWGNDLTPLRRRVKFRKGVGELRKCWRGKRHSDGKRNSRMKEWGVRGWSGSKG